MPISWSDSAYTITPRSAAQIAAIHREYPEDRGLRGWRVGVSLDVHSTAFARIMRQPEFRNYGGRQPLVKWWEQEIASLPLDIPPSM